MIVWNFQNGWASFLFQGPRRWSTGPHFQLPALLLYVLALITPLGVAGFISALRRPARGFLFCTVFTLVPVATGMFGGVYLASASVLGAAFIFGATRLLRSRTNRDALRLYLGSLAYLFLLFAAMAADKLLAA